MKMISQAKAKSLGFVRFYTGKPCVNGHISERYVSGWRCVTCALNWSAQQPNKASGKYNPEQKAQYYSANKQQIADRKKSNAAAKQGISLEEYKACKEKTKQARLANGGKCSKEQAKRYALKRYAKDKVNIIAENKARKAKKAKQVPPWADKKSILFFYKEAARLTIETGLAHHVDHIIPLCGRLVTGLHCQHNLQVITAAENLKKNNRFDPAKHEHSIP